MEREDLIQVGWKSLVPGGPYQRCCITGALEHHQHDRVRLVCIPHRCWSSWWISSPPRNATALQLSILDGLSMRAATEQLEISAMSVSHREMRFAAQRAQKKALAALRQQFTGES